MVAPSGSMSRRRKSVPLVVAAAVVAAAGRQNSDNNNKPLPRGGVLFLMIHSPRPHYSWGLYCGQRSTVGNRHRQGAGSATAPGWAAKHRSSHVPESRYQFTARTSSGAGAATLPVFLRRALSPPLFSDPATEPFGYGCRQEDSKYSSLRTTP
jgi:hypothetical protein